MSVPLTARAPIEFWPPALVSRNTAILAENVERAKRGEKELELIRVMVRVPTMYERDAYAATLVRGGVVHYSRDQIRDLMLAGIAFLYPEDRFDAITGDLLELWQVGDANARCADLRQQRMQEILEQQAAEQKTKGKKFVPMTEEEVEKELNAIQPEMVMEERKRVRITAIQQDVTARYDPLQKAFADLAEQDTRRDWVSVETYVCAWHGLEHTPDGNGRGGITRSEAEYLRQDIGSDAFQETAAFIFSMHGIDGDEEKNLASLIGSLSSPVGSTAMEPSPVSKGTGNSTAEPSSSTLVTA